MPTCHRQHYCRCFGSSCDRLSCLLLLLCLRPSVRPAESECGCGGGCRVRELKSVVKSQESQLKKKQDEIQKLKLMLFEQEGAAMAEEN